MNMKAKLQRMKGHLTSENQDKDELIKTPHKYNKKTSEDYVNGDEEYELIRRWGKLGFKPYYLDDQISFQRRELYPLTNQEGLNKRKTLLDIQTLWKKSKVEHPLTCKDVPLPEMLFFDTETTGLSTGAGNTIFLIGYAKVLETGIEVVQHILGDPASEGAFMHGFLQDFHEDDYLVSYNGKAFDWPQVKSRHAFVRNQVPKLPLFGHIDLLHAARRLWKHELPSCRLSIVEQEKLGIKRVNDTPGSMAPLLYYDYLHDKNPSHLEGIIEHNDQDVRSLIDLYISISNRLFHRGNSPVTSMEHIQIGRWFEQTGGMEQAKDHYEIAAHHHDRASSEALYRLGLLLKKLGDIEGAKFKFLSCVRMQGSSTPDSYIELAKISEHQDKDVHLAYDYTKQALMILKKSARMTGVNKKVISEVDKRLLRLEKKLSK